MGADLMEGKSRLSNGCPKNSPNRLVVAPCHLVIVSIVHLRRGTGFLSWVAFNHPFASLYDTVTPSASRFDSD